MDKRSFINALFIISFPVYGIGTYVSASASPSLGYLLSFSVHFVMVLFYLVDLLYRKGFQMKLNWVYGAMMLYTLSVIVSLFIALGKGLPETNIFMTVARSLLLLFPFQAFVVAGLYNEGHEDEFPVLVVKGLSALLFVNLVGYFALGLSNASHSIEGRLNLPFLDGFYSGASIIAILNLLLIPVIRATKNPLHVTGLIAFFAVNLVLFYMINSRLAIMIFIIIVVLMMFRMVAARGIFLVSIFTLPILLSSGLLLYEIVQWPGVSTVMQRIDIEDVTTFHGRSFLWEDGMDWLINGREGLLLGNGYKGHYFLDMVGDVAKMWNTDEAFHLHMHSTSLEVVICQGLLSYLLLCVLLYRIYGAFRSDYKSGVVEGAFLAPVIYLLFILQVDTFAYLDSLGFVIFALFVSRVCITRRVATTAGIEIRQSVRRRFPLAQQEEILAPI